MIPYKNRIELIPLQPLKKARGFLREYRELARHMPTEALLSKELSAANQENAFPYLYQYVDLCNEQTFCEWLVVSARQHGCSGARGYAQIWPVLDSRQYGTE
jgi:hypothetical protein